MKIFFLPQKGNEEPWMSDFIAAVGGRCPVVIYDETKPLAPQFEGVEYVVELGGKVATHEIIDTARAAGVRFWQIMGTGMDHVDILYFEQQGIPLSNTPGQFSSLALAEHAIYLMLCLVKGLAATRRCFPERVFYRPVGEDLDGKKLGLVGLGASGRELAKRAHGLGMHIVAIDAADIPEDTLAHLHVGWCGGPDDLARLLEESDFVSIHVPLLRSTRHMINAEALKRMKSSAYLINVARGAHRRSRGADRGSPRRHNCRSRSRRIRRGTIGSFASDSSYGQRCRHAAHSRRFEKHVAGPIKGGRGQCFSCRGRIAAALSGDIGDGHLIRCRKDSRGVKVNVGAGAQCPPA